MGVATGSRARRVRGRGEKGERTAAAILDAAEACFARSGYAGTTLRDIADAVGLREPSIYNHFPNKDALYASVLERALQPLVDALDEQAESPGDDPAAVVLRMIALQAENPNIARLLQLETLSPTGELNPVVRDWFERLFDLGRRAGDRARGPAATDALSVLAMYNLVVGYFANKQLLDILGLDGPTDADLLEQQAALLRRVVRALASGPPGDSEDA